MSFKGKMSDRTYPRLLGFGISLLDIIIDNSQDLLDMYNLPANGEVRISESDELISIFKDVSLFSNDRLHFRPGGATLNALKVAQWCLGNEGRTVVISCVNDDFNGQTLRQAMAQAGVDALFQVKSGAPTGSCLVICTGADRCLVTYGGVSYNLTVDIFDEEDTKAAVEASEFFYCSGYSLVGCFEAIERLAVHANESSDKVFALNMAATYVCQQYADHFKSILPFVDVLFGNQTEAYALSQACGLQAHTCEDIALQLCMWKRERKKRLSRVIVITQGAYPALLAVDNKVMSFPAPTIPEGEIVDANGAGDAFVGGFLSSLMKKQTYDAAVMAGHKAAGIVLRQRGCDLPDISWHQCTI
ncbi:hypothetical protein RRG08_055901 [Elysia crispata]|uniref:Adenosine kinase n=1 Tax=Elysia crispata TaxID=231223 RepID=A0AAE0Y4J0_9GAST|nr:hypothetical protein RRG08_055901 [Elysia crispata]